MSWVCEVVIQRGTRPDRSPSDDLARAIGSWFAAGPGTAWANLPGLRSFDGYDAVDAGRDPFVNDGPGPLLLAILDFATPEALGAAMRSPHLAEAIRILPPGAEALATAFERRFYPIDGETAGSGWTAPVSYVVRYHRPAEDEAAFVANYVASHPPTLARLPGIRSVMCYFPMPELNTPVLACADYMIGNEVAFDSVEAFNAAMASPVRQELRAHYREFPPFTGASTHHLMRRRRLAG